MSAPNGSARRLAETTLALVDIPSVSRDEAAIAAHVRETMAPLAELAHEDEGTLYFRTPATGKPLVLLAGHLDTVPPQGNHPGRLEDGVVWGLGASDMKSGLAVMIEVARWLAGDDVERDVDLGWVFFAREELPADQSPLPAFFAAVPEVAEAELAIVLEPTDGTIQAGCLGHLQCDLVYEGLAAHSARPWQGRNAIEVAVSGLAPIVTLEPRAVTLSGLEFVEVLSVTSIEGGVAANVIPDRVTCRLSYRYGPDRTPAEAEAELRRLVGDAGRLEDLGNSAPAPVVVDTPLARRLRAAGDFELQPKQAWTPVAEFAAAGIDAVNLGPGETRYAHKRDEQVRVSDLERTFRALQRFVADGA